MLKTIKSIQKHYNTGELPILALCSDLHEYICKYPRFSGSQFKLVCELAGAVLAQAINLRIPPFAIISIAPEHWPLSIPRKSSAPVFGSRMQPHVVDVTSSWDKVIEPSKILGLQIARIGLFDIWVGNEDRNWNNANLLYDVNENELIVIDHGCIFNTATFDYPLTLLTHNESILYSELAGGILQSIDSNERKQILSQLKTDFDYLLDNRNLLTHRIMGCVPAEWCVKAEIIRQKLNQLFDSKWMNDSWQTFLDYFDDI